MTYKQKNKPKECWYCGANLNYYRKNHPERKELTDEGFCDLKHKLFYRGKKK